MKEQIHYTYMSYETNKGIYGLKYIGKRKCPQGYTPETDPYWGTPVSPKNQEFKLNEHKEKRILGVFDNDEDATEHEVFLHNLYQVDTDPRFANQAKQTSKKFSYSASGPDNYWFGKTLSLEHRENLSKAKVGKIKHTEETKARLSELFSGENNPMFGLLGENHPAYGYKHTPEAKQSMSESKKGEKNPFYGKPLSDEHKASLSKSIKATWTDEKRASISGENSPRFGTKLSEETKARCSISQKKSWTDERRRKHSEYLRGDSSHLKGFKHTEEAKQAISRASSGANNKFFGKTHSSETLERISGKNHYRYDPTLRDWVNTITGDTEYQVTIDYMKKKYPSTRSSALHKVARGDYKSHIGWKLRELVKG